MTEIPEQIPSLKEWKTNKYFKLAEQIYDDVLHFKRNRVRAQTAKNFVGAWFAYYPDEAPPNKSRIVRSDFSNIMVTPERDFIDLEYNDVEIPPDTPLLSVHDPTKEMDQISADFMISDSLKFYYQMEAVTFFHDPDTMGLQIKFLHGGPARCTSRYIPINGLKNIRWIETSGNMMRIDFLEFLEKQSRDKTVAAAYYNKDGKLIKKQLWENDDKVVNLGQARKQKSNTERIGKRRERLKYEWLVTYNRKGSHNLTIVDYIPFSKISHYTQGHEMTKEELVPPVKEYLKELAEEIGFKSGTITMWKLVPWIDMPSRTFERGEKIDVAELDETYGESNYEFFTSHFINSHLRLVNY